MEAKQPNWGLSTLYWLSWLFCGFLIIVNILEIREASLAVITTIHYASSKNSSEDNIKSEQFDATLHAIDILMFFLGAILGVSLAVLIEYYFRFGLIQGNLLQRIGKVVGIQVIFIITCVIVRTLASIFLLSAP